MQIDVHFSGCSCGCTPSQYETFEGEAPDIYVAIAEWAEQFRAAGDNPFRKLTIPEESKAYILKYIEFDEKIKAKIREIDLASGALAVKWHKKQQYMDAAKLLGIDPPPHIVEEIKKLENEGDLREKLDRLQAEKSDLVTQRNLIFSHDRSKARKQESDTEEDCDFSN